MITHRIINTYTPSGQVQHSAMMWLRNKDTLILGFCNTRQIDIRHSQFHMSVLDNEPPSEVPFYKRRNCKVTLQTQILGKDHTTDPPPMKEKEPIWQN